MKPCHNYYQWLNNSAARLRVGLYERFIREWLDVFPREQMLFIKFEEYVDNQFDIIQNQIFPFLGVPKLTLRRASELKNALEKSTGSNKTHKNLTVLPETEEILRNFYGPYNRELSKLLGDDKWLWDTS